MHVVLLDCIQIYACALRRPVVSHVAMHADDHSQLMSLDEFGKPVAVVSPATKGQPKTASSTGTPPSPKSKTKASASVNKAVKSKSAALDVGSGTPISST